MKKYLQELRLLRIVMIIFTLALAVLSRFAGDEVFYSGWKIIPTLIAPAVAPIMFFVIWLDVLMSWVFSIDAAQGEKSRFGRIIITDVVLVIVLTVSWFGYFSSLVS
jgi:hypothetical protein